MNSKDLKSVIPGKIIVLNFIHRSSIAGFISIAFFLLVFQAQAVFIKVGPFSLNVYATVLAAGFALVSFLSQLLLSCRLEPRTSPWRLGAKTTVLVRVLWPLIILLSISSVRLIFHWRIEGAQNLLALTILVVGTLALATELDAEKIKSILNVYLYVSLVVSAVFIVFSVTGLQGFANRQFAMIMLVSLSVAAVWPGSTWLLRAAPYFLTFAIVLSQSRTAAVVALLLLGAHIFWVRRDMWKTWVRLLVFGAATGVIIILAVLAPLWLESIAGAELGVEERDYLGTSGRFPAWVEFISLLQQPAEWVFGLGTGAAMAYGAAEMKYFPHPHNEYLRFLVDLGLLGVTLLLLGAIFLLRIFYRSWPISNAVSRAAFLVLVSLALVSTTDGPLYSSFVIIPATLVIGFGLASIINSGPSLANQQAKKDA